MLGFFMDAEGSMFFSWKRFIMADMARRILAAAVYGKGIEVWWHWDWGM